MAIVKVNEFFFVITPENGNPSYKTVFFPDGSTCKVTSMYEGGRNESRTYDLEEVEQILDLRYSDRPGFIESVAQMARDIEDLKARAQQDHRRGTGQETVYNIAATTKAPSIEKSVEYLPDERRGR